jgi:3,5-epimerase/4-reductase
MDVWLLYGANGWIGSQLVSILESQGQTIIKGKSRIDDYISVYNEVSKVNPHRVICTTGRTSGPGYPNIDYLELPDKLTENLRDNLKAPLTLAQVCGQLGLHLTYLGTGCLYAYDSSHPIENCLQKGFTETDEPNFMGSQYSIVKGITDRLINNMPHVLNARIRMPISDQVNPRNFVTKITQYAKVISIPNSMTVLPELLPIMIDMAKNKVTGSVNLTNPGAITHQEILDLYKEHVDPTFTYEIMDLNELSKYTVGKRSNNYLSTQKLESMYKVTPIKEAVTNVLKKMGKKN